MITRESLLTDEERAELPPPEKRVSNHGGDSVWLMEEGETREECIRQYRSQKTDSGKGQEKV